MRVPSRGCRLLAAAVVTLLMFAGSAKAEPAQVWICVPQHPFRSFDALTRGGQQLFARVGGSDAKVRVFRNPRDMAEALKTQRPACALVDASVAPELARQGLRPALAVVVDGRPVRRRVLLEKAGASGGVTATTHHPSAAVPGSSRFVDATSDASALDAVRLGVAQRAIVNWASFVAAVREDAALRGLPWRIVAVLPEESNAVLCVSDNMRDALVKGLTQASGDTQKALLEMGIQAFTPTSGVPSVSSAAPTPSASVAGKAVALRLPINELLPADARTLLEKGVAVRVDSGSPPPLKSSGRLLNDGVVSCRVDLPSGAGSVVTYTTKPGDTLSDIAQQFLGDPDKYLVIAHDNHLSNPNALEPGTVLKIHKGGAGPTTLKVDAAVEGASKTATYTVRCTP